MTFTQLTARLQNLFMGWLLILGLNECLVECATVCVKSVVILKDLRVQSFDIYYCLVQNERDNSLIIL